jgi:sodium-coupled monocarboxylate transporter 8/12
MEERFAATAASIYNNTLLRTDLLNKEELIPKFGVVNYVVFAAMLFVSAVIGAYFWWRGQKNTEEFLMASRSMGTFPMCLSLIASFMSAITLLGTPAEMYVSGKARELHSYEVLLTRVSRPCNLN